MSKPNLKRDDGTFWRSSYDPKAPMIGLFDSSRAYFFRQVERHWLFGWRETGRTWEGGDLRKAGFDLIKDLSHDPS